MTALGTLDREIWAYEFGTQQTPRKLRRVADHDLTESLRLNQGKKWTTTSSRLIALKLKTWSVP